MNAPEDERVAGPAETEAPPLDAETSEADVADEADEPLVEDQQPSDPYAKLERVFDEMAGLPPETGPDPADLWATVSERMELFETEIRTRVDSGIEALLNAIDRMGAELAGPAQDPQVAVLAGRMEALETGVRTGLDQGLKSLRSSLDRLTAELAAAEQFDPTARLVARLEAFETEVRNRLEGLARMGAEVPGAVTQASVDARMEAFEAQIRTLLNKWLEAVRGSYERMRENLAALDARTVALELDMRRLRATAQTIDANVRLLFQALAKTGPAAEPPAALPAETTASEPEAHPMIDRIWQEES